MPIYAYECCNGHLQEVINTSCNDVIEIVKCNRCNEEMQRIISPTNFVLQGAGWTSRGSITSLDGWNIRKKRYNTAYEAKHDINGVVTEGPEK